jgi:hypothetical protein
MDQLSFNTKSVENNMNNSIQSKESYESDNNIEKDVDFNDYK